MKATVNTMQCDGEVHMKDSQVFLGLIVKGREMDEDGKGMDGDWKG